MNCPKCNVEGLQHEIDKDVTTFLCVECGYLTNTGYTTKNFEFQPTVIRMDAQTKAMVWKDSKTGLYWFPINFDLPKIGILHPMGTVEHMEWVYMPMIDMTDEEKRKNPGKKEKPDEYRRKVYTTENLKEALKLLKIID